MSKPINKTMIGLFCGGGHRSQCCGDRGPGLGEAFKERFHYHMVFEGSVKGLNVVPRCLRGSK